jgi:hypothetical protein
MDPAFSFPVDLEREIFETAAQRHFEMIPLFYGSVNESISGELLLYQRICSVN